MHLIVRSYWQGRKAQLSNGPPMTSPTKQLSIIRICCTQIVIIHTRKTIFVKIEDNCSYEFVFCLSHLRLYCTCCIQIICLSLLTWSFCVRLLNWLLLILFFSDLDTLYSASYGIKSLHHNAESCIKWAGSTFHCFKVGTGVRQGGILSTDLYKLYINPLLDRLQDVGIGLKIGNINVNNTGCADDIAVLSLVMHRSWSTWLLTLRTSRDVNYNQEKCSNPHQRKQQTVRNNQRET